MRPRAELAVRVSRRVGPEKLHRLAPAAGLVAGVGPLEIGAGVAAALPAHRAPVGAVGDGAAMGHARSLLVEGVPLAQLGVDLRTIRICRMLRLFRTLKLMRYSRAVAHFRYAFVLARGELILFFSAAFALVYLSAAGIYCFERDAQPEAFARILHSLWWAVVTLTTVGSGDVDPVTVGGRVLTFLVLMIGPGILAVPSGLMASALGGAAARRGRDREQPHRGPSEWRGRRRGVS